MVCCQLPGLTADLLAGLHLVEHGHTLSASPINQPSNEKREYHRLPSRGVLHRLME